jgi:hypothetical protein
MGPCLIVFLHPLIEVGLQLFDAPVDLLAEGDAVELVEQRLVEALTDPVILRAACLGAGVVDVFDRQLEFVLVPIMGAAEFCAAIGEHAIDAQPMLVKERDHPVVQQVGRGQRGLAIVELGETHLRVGVDPRLLADAPHPFSVPT